MAAVQQHTRMRSVRIASSTKATAPATAATATTTAAAPPSSSSFISGSGSGVKPSVSAVSLFLTNLRLLDLDLLPDWPGIASDTFSASTGSGTAGHKKRVQCVEWALFQLFSIWDAEETRNKLKPFYPPLDQVQSINLRAALLRGLEQAKKNGVLGRDAILRKTMLDECKGERLEEVLAAFSTAVLKKVVGEQVASSRSHPAIAFGLAFENRGYKGERVELDILSMAHRFKLQRLLERKEAARARYGDFSDLLGVKERNIARRREELHAKQQDPARDKISEQARAETRRLVRNNWTGDDHWADALLHGNATSQQDGLLSMPFDRVWRRVQQNRLAEVEDGPGGLLEQLESRVKMQQDRLHRWNKYKKETFCERLPDKAIQKQHPGNGGKGIDLGFGAHEAIQLGKTVPAKDIAGTVKRNDYTDLVQSLHDGLANVKTKKRGDPLAFLQHYKTRPRRESKSHRHKLSTSSIGADGVISDLSELEDEVEAAVAKPPAKPFQAKLEGAKRMPVRPKLDSSTDRPSGFLAQRQKPIMSPEKDFEIEIPALSQPRSPPKPPKEAEKVATPPRYRTPTPEELPAEVAEELPDIPPSPTQELADKILEDMNNASPSPGKRGKPRHTLSLAERTRLTMARGSSLFLQDDEPDLPSPPPVPLEQVSTPSSDGETKQLGLDPTEDLASRTRRSMAGFEKARQKAQLERRRSQRRPKMPAARRDGGAFPAVSEEPQDQSVLAEDLLAEEDMEAVFRSRPKIKASPIPSPTREWDADEYM